jgi:hypothetical protein
MEAEEEKSIKWGDLDNPLLTNTLSRLVVKVIRNCLLTYSPVIMVVVGALGWYFNGISSGIKEISSNQNQLKVEVAKQAVAIDAMRENFDLKIELNK